MNLKQWIKGIALMALFFASADAFAQQEQQRPPASPEQRATRQTRMMDKTLALTKGQYDKVYAINLYYAREMANANADAQQGANNKGEKKALRNDKDNELKQVLTAAQYEKYLSFKEEMKERNKARREQTMQGNN